MTTYLQSVPSTTGGLEAGSACWRRIRDVLLLDMRGPWHIRTRCIPKGSQITHLALIREKFKYLPLKIACKRIEAGSNSFRAYNLGDMGETFKSGTRVSPPVHQAWHIPSERHSLLHWKP
jgi:hypothetical protein